MKVQVSRTGVQVGAVDVADNGGLGQDQQVVVALEVVRMILEPLAAIIGFLQPVALDHRAHGSVEDEQALREQGGEFGGTVGLHHDHLGKAAGSHKFTPGAPEKTNGATNRQGFASAVDHCRAWPRIHADA